MGSDYPCTAAEAVKRALAMVGKGGQYVLGTGDYWPPSDKTIPDVPWTTNHYGTGSDCAGFAICYCWKVIRHRPGFNRGFWASVSDDINVNSAIEDAQHKRDLFTLAGDTPQPGDLVCYPTIRIRDGAGQWHEFIGHVAIVVTVPADYKPGEGYHRLKLAQCHGPNGFKPGVVTTDGSGFDMHNGTWPTIGHCVLIRPKERA